MEPVRDDKVGDVWTLETPAEQVAIEDLNIIIDSAYKRSGIRERDYLRKLWDGESWKSVKNKLETEGSTWYVWWMDGVRVHYANMIGGRGINRPALKHSRGHERVSAKKAPRRRILPTTIRRVK